MPPRVDLGPLLQSRFNLESREELNQRFLLVQGLGRRMVGRGRRLRNQFTYTEFPIISVSSVTDSITAFGCLDLRYHGRLVLSEHVKYLAGYHTTFKINGSQSLVLTSKCAQDCPSFKHSESKVLENSPLSGKLR